MGFGGLWAAKWDRRVGRVRFNSDSDVRVGHVDWQAFGATVRSPFLRLHSRAQRATKSGDSGGPRATWRADNAGEMCTGIIFPGKCGVIEKKGRECRGRERRSDACSRVIRTLFRAGARERAQRMEKGRRAHHRRFYLMPLDGNESND